MGRGGARAPHEAAPRSPGGGRTSACSVWRAVSSMTPRDRDGPHPPPQAPTFKPYPMKTHLVLPFPVSYVGDCVRTAPYTHPDHARYGASARGAEADRRGASALRVWELASSVRLRQHGGPSGGHAHHAHLAPGPGPPRAQSHRSGHTCSRRRALLPETRCSPRGARDTRPDSEAGSREERPTHGRALGSARRRSSCRRTRSRRP